MTSTVKRLSLLAAALTVAAVFVLPTAVVQGDEFNFLTYITVSQPFQVPGAVLQPNTKYVFRRMDAASGLNHVVRVMNEDQTKVISTFFAVSDYRLEPTGDTVMTFMETAPGYPKPVRTWFYPGRIDGLEFIYSKQERAEIAAHGPRSARAEVQTASMTQSETAAPAEEAAPAPAVEETAAVMPQSTEAASEQPAAVEPAPVTEQAPAVEEAASTPAPAPSMDQNTNSNSDRELPHTAGELPLLGLIGLASLGLRQALRRY